MRFLLALTFALCLPVANAATDGSSLQQLNTALTAYQHDHGELPQVLGDLVPHYLPAVPEGCTYDFGADPAPPDFSVVLSVHPVPEHASTRDLRVIEERYFGDSVTVATCALASGERMYLTLGGQAYSSRRPWEFTPQSIEAVLSRMNRDLAANPAQFLRDWSLNGVLKLFSPMVDRELPPGARAGMGEIAGRLSASAQKMPPSVDREEMFSVAAWFHMGAFQFAPAMAAAQSAELKPLLVWLRYLLSGKRGVPPVDDYVRAEMETQQIPGMSIAVVRDGEVVLEKGYGFANLEDSAPAGKDTVYRIASVTKPFMAMALMKMVEEEKLSLDDPVGKFLPDLPASWRPIPIKNLLDMTSGIQNIYDIGIPWEQFQLDTTPQAIVSKMSSYPLLFHPGERWNYSSTNYILLRLVLEKVTGKPLGTLLNEVIFAPLEMRSTGVLSYRTIIKNRAAQYTRQNGTVVNSARWSPTWGTGGAELVSTAADLARWNAGLDRRKILRSSSYDEMWKSWTTAGGGEFGLGWFLSRSRGRDTIWFSGGTPGSAPDFTRLVDDKLTVIVLANTDAMDSQAMAADIAQFFLAPPRSIEDNDPSMTQQLERRLTEFAAEPNSFYKGLGSLKSFHLVRQTIQDGKRVRGYQAVFENAELIQTFTLTASGDIAEASVSFE
ncbi:MAG: serine hydrolase domain-containing protein [Terriglobales bacterium]